MIEIFELRNKPELTINLSEGEIEIIDATRAKNCGTFSFNTIKSVELNLKRTDWFITSVSWIVDLFIGGGYDNYKNSANMKLETVDQTLKIWLHNADFSKAERITKLINDRKTLNVS